MDAASTASGRDTQSIRVNSRDCLELFELCLEMRPLRMSIRIWALHTCQAANSGVVVRAHDLCSLLGASLRGCLRE